MGLYLRLRLALEAIDSANINYSKLSKLLKASTHLNHFALKTKLYVRAVQVAFDALRQLEPVRLAA